jgi:hypothetical protein
VCIRLVISKRGQGPTKWVVKRNFFIIPVYLQSVQAHSVNLLKDVDEWLGEGR